MTTLIKHGTWICGLALAGTLGTGCGVTIDGEEGNLSFEYANSALSGAFSKDIAVGAMVDIEVTEPDGEALLPIEEVASSAEDVLSVAEVGTSLFTLLAESEGVARISVTATGPEGSLSDAVELYAAELARLEIDGTCGADSVYAINSPIELNYRMLDANGKGLNGYGLYPVAVEPAEGGVVNEAFTRLGKIQIHTGDVAGSYQLTSELLDEPYALTLIAPEDIAELDVSHQVDDENIMVVLAGEQQDVAIFAMADGAGAVVCGPANGAFEMVSQTPEICEAHYGYVMGLHYVKVEGLGVGECEISLSVPGTELSETIQVQIAESHVAE
ncbi:hypothetical protein DL240_17935 [Lujinxingia litoralis]|uniref:Uncharacterized protein n=1 Tax=Lujinxingia litoralis TaxID=2211119 RepID=A0A328C5G5_9DELT|nr:hypothetical protein [Lujinxingia litoralis]RAL20260.1 hypothetical protein DL240_17935 [Lujinxingia litoralis]